MPQPLTEQYVEDRIEEAARTLRRIPNPPGSGPKGFSSSWPEYVQDKRHGYGLHEAPMRIIPSAAEIDRMEEVFDWLRLVDSETARLLWYRASGMRWRQVCIQIGCVRQTAWRRYVAALITVRKRLEKQRKTGKPSRVALGGAA